MSPRGLLRTHQATALWSMRLATGATVELPMQVPAEGDDALFLSVHWQLWIVENLLLGSEPLELVQALEQEGIARNVAIYYVEQSVLSDAFGRMRKRAQRAALTERAFSLINGSQQAQNVPRVASLTDAEFYQQYFKPMLPVVLTEQLRTLLAHERWTFANLRARFGSQPVEITTHRDAAKSPSAVESRSEPTQFSDFLEHTLSASGNDRYLVARNGLLHQPAFVSLIEEIAPLPPFLTSVDRAAPAVSLWIGPAKTHTPLHFDPHSALLIQVRGRKRVRLIAPTESVLYELADGYFLRCDLDDPQVQEHPEFKRNSVVTLELGEGDALFLPALWWHDVVALEPSVMLSCLNFRWPNNFHAIHPEESGACGHAVANS